MRRFESKLFFSQKPKKCSMKKDTSIVLQVFFFLVKINLCNLKQENIVFKKLGLFYSLKIFDLKLVSFLVILLQFSKFLISYVTLIRN